MTDTGSFKFQIMSSKMKILFVEDDSDSREGYQYYFGIHLPDTEFITVGSAQEALVQVGQGIDKTPFDLIISDVEMSGMSGIELVVELRSRYGVSAPQVVLISVSPEKYQESADNIGVPLIDKLQDLQDFLKRVKEGVYKKDPEN
jgi:CheY-like chemotaxis protein